MKFQKCHHTNDYTFLLFSDDEESDEGRFFFVILNMACIEVIMHLEEQNLDIVMANSELLVACYFIVESAVSYLSNPENHLSSVLKQKLRIQQSLNNAFAGKHITGMA